MALDMTKSDRERLRALAQRQACYAALPIMDERRRRWYTLNDGAPGSAPPPVIIETWTFDRDFLPDSVFVCETADGRAIERELLRNVRNHEILDDDKVMPDTFEIGWHVSIDEMGVPIPRDVVQDSEGVDLGYQYHYPFKDLPRDLERLTPASCSVDRDSTFARKAELEELFGDLLPVTIRGGCYACTNLTQRVVQLMGMEAFFIAMYDQPEAVHALMGFLRDNALRVMRWAEAEGLLTANNGNQCTASSFHFTEQLPSAPSNGDSLGLQDTWGAANSQETVGVAPPMFHEFCFPYYRDVCAPVGLLYWGCCEPADPFWGDLSQLPHLKKVSISRWCDQVYMGEALRGTGIVFSRKPDPNFLGVDVQLDESAWAAHIRETLDAAAGADVEFIIRDVYTVHGDLEKARRAVAIARDVIDSEWGS
jgi:hypothetical protein